MAKITFTNPTWATIQDQNPPNNVSVATSTPIGYRGNDDTVTAFQFCEVFDYTLVEFVVGNNANPTVSWDDGNQQRWENDGSEPSFLQITCDNGVNESIGEVNIANVGDLILLQAIIISVLVMMLVHQIFGRT